MHTKRTHLKQTAGAKVLMQVRFRLDDGPDVKQLTKLVTARSIRTLDQPLAVPVAAAPPNRNAYDPFGLHGVDRQQREAVRQQHPYVVGQSGLACAGATHVERPNERFVVQ